MVSFEAPLSPMQNSKRKYSTWQGDDHDQENFQNGKKSRHVQETESLFDVELHVETPLPLEWQRCLDIKVHFYNSRTQKRTSHDPRSGNDGHMRLSLELNLVPCDSADDHLSGDLFMDSKKHRRLPSWLAFERGEEMVATVCSQCNMLVMLCKSSPACPNCKFMHHSLGAVSCCAKFQVPGFPT